MSHPLGLTDDQFAVVLDSASRIPQPDRRADFVAAIFDRLLVSTETKTIGNDDVQEAVQRVLARFEVAA